MKSLSNQAGEVCFKLRRTGWPRLSASLSTLRATLQICRDMGATRYDRNIKTFFGAISIAAAVIWWL